jgi:uncharacterized protein involved in exopolysaccharide biosynthesis
VRGRSDFEDEVEVQSESMQIGFIESLRDPVGVARRRWRPMLAIVSAGFLATSAYALKQKTTYRAEATVLVASQRLSAEFVRPTIEEDVLERVNALMGEALSRQSLTKLIEKNELYPALRARFGMDAAVGTLRGAVSVRVEEGVVDARNERARILSIQFVSEDPELAARVANDVAEAFATAGMRLRTQQVRLTTDFMRRELEAAETALREEGRKISEFQQKHRGRLPSELEANLRRLERLQDQRSSLAMQIVEAETRIAQMAAVSSGVDPKAARLQELNTALTRELAINTEDHPNVVALRRQIRNVQSQAGGSMGGNRGAVMAAAQREVAQLRTQLEETDRASHALDAQVASIPAVGEEFTALEQRATVLRDNYLEFLRKLKDAELAESLELAQQGDRVAILDEALPPMSPQKGRRKIVTLGTLLSLAAALAAALALEQLDPVLVSAAAVEAVSGAPVLGSLPRIS